VARLARCVASAQPSDYVAAARILRYLKGTKAWGLHYLADASDFYGYVDADLAGDAVDRRSRTGYVFMLAGGPVSWGSTKQPTVTTSTTSAELVALFGATKEVLWLRKAFVEFGMTCPAKTVIYEDNSGVVALAETGLGSRRTKHMDVKYYYMLEHSGPAGSITILKVGTKENRADIFTKALDRNTFEYLRGLLLSKSHFGGGL
jgi:hypothetical protein